VSFPVFFLKQDKWADKNFDKRYHMKYSRVRFVCGFKRSDLILQTPPAAGRSISVLSLEKSFVNPSRAEPILANPYITALLTAEESQVTRVDVRAISRCYLFYR